ncbi:MAG TPA: DUF4398 domain-containing protein, partial [Myxococcaceae bacterium]|nr:DUF4398 domain-containing protein [Myxococcaceae bacterium]
MKRHLTLLFSAGALLSAAGCATVIPPRELVEAREEYAVASSTQVAEASPVELREAARALDRAEREFSKHPRSKKVQDLAYIAKRKAQIAESLARTEQLRQTKARAQAELRSRLGGQYALTEAERLRARLAEEQRLRQEREAELLRSQADASERAARLEAERLAREQQTESERRAQAQLEQERRAREALESERRASEAQA